MCRRLPEKGNHHFELKGRKSMAEIKPFKALRFCEKAGNIKELCCPPYDIISEEERENFLKTNEHNVIRLEKPEGGDPYNTAARTLKNWLADGIVATDRKESIYIYEEEFKIGGKSYSFKGFISRVKLVPFSENVVLPHEETLSKAKEDRLNLMKAASANFSQIYSLYFDEEHKTPKLLDEMSSGKAAAEFTDGDGVTHRLWICDDSQKISTLCEQFKDRKLYIADGHHRYETGLNYKKYCRENGLVREGGCDYIMMMCVDIENDGLVIFPTHRVVRGLKGFNSEELLEKCCEYFTVQTVKCEKCVNRALKEKYDEGKKAFGYYDGKKYAVLTLKKDVSEIPEFSKTADSLRQLDVSVLHTLILENILGIDKENMAKQINLTYTRDDAEARRLVVDGADCCFILNPTRITEIAAVAGDGEKMPQKSTYFYPKLITGLVMNLID